MLSILADTFRIATFQLGRDDPAARHRAAKEEQRRLRAQLPQLDAHLLRDIGLDPDTIDEEERPPLWRLSGR